MQVRLAYNGASQRWDQFRCKHLRRDPAPVQEDSRHLSTHNVPFPADFPRQAYGSYDPPMSREFAGSGLATAVGLGSASRFNDTSMPMMEAPSILQAQPLQAHRSMPSVMDIGYQDCDAHMDAFPLHSTSKLYTEPARTDGSSLLRLESLNFINDQQGQPHLILHCC